MNYGYKMGEFSEITLPEWVNGQSYEEWLDSCGYGKYPLFDENSDSLKIHKHRDNGTYFADICLDGCECNHVIIADYPSLLHFLSNYAHGILLPTKITQAEQLTTTLEKAFRAFHGHHWLDPCPKCSPGEYNQMMRDRDERAKAKAAK